MKRFLFSVVAIVSLPLVGACTKSVDRAARDVDRAQQQAARDVREEQRELEDVKRDSSERIARQERRVEDAARRANEQVIEEQRELEEARRAEARQDDAITPVPPRPEDRSAADRPARVEVDIDRTPRGGVNVEVNPKR